MAYKLAYELPWFRLVGAGECFAGGGGTPSKPQEDCNGVQDGTPETLVDSLNSPFEASASVSHICLSDNHHIRHPSRLRTSAR